MYLGNQPALSYTSFAKQDFSTSATTSYSLDHPVANANELALFINFVRQEPTTSYSASGTTLTLTEATSSSDDMYCVYLGKAVQTVNPPNASVGASQLVDASITSGKLASGVLPTNTPAFALRKNTGSNQSTSTGSKNLITWDTAQIDTHNGFNNSTDSYTIPTGQGGIYYCTLAVTWSASTRMILFLEKNGTVVVGSDGEDGSNYAFQSFSSLLNLSAGDVLKTYYYMVSNGGNIIVENSAGQYLTRFEGFKLT